jgi:tellurite resistance protein TerC
MDVLLWIGFIALILILLFLDLGVFNKENHVFTHGEALAWSGLWVFMSLLFNVLIYFMYENHWLGIGQNADPPLDGSNAALLFFTGYLVEKSLSLDNIFVIALIFAYFRVPLIYQHRVLFWGIAGALVLRFIMIMLGSALLTRFSWITYVFGLILIATAVKMLIARQENMHPENNPLVRLTKKFFPVTHDHHGDHFFVKLGQMWHATPLFLALVVVESSDILFAIDSIPAIFAITSEPFIVFTSNIFAILGLRSLYFLLANMLERFFYLKTSLVFLLVFIGVKMLLMHHYPIPAQVSLVVIISILLVGVFASLLASKKDPAHLEAPLNMELSKLSKLTLHQVRRLIILVIGGTIVLLGLVLLITPGPALLVIPIGLAILGREFVWAKKMCDKLQETGNDLVEKVRRRPKNGTKNPPKDKP